MYRTLGPSRPQPAVPTRSPPARVTPTAPMPRSAFVARWLRRSHRCVAAMLLGVLALGCGEPVVDAACCGWLPAVEAPTSPSADVPTRPLIGAVVAGADRHAAAPGSRPQPAAPRATTHAPCACAGGMPASGKPELAATDGADIAAAPRGGDSVVPPSPVLELHLRPPVTRLG